MLANRPLYVLRLLVRRCYCMLALPLSSAEVDVIHFQKDDDLEIGTLGERLTSVGRG